MFNEQNNYNSNIDDNELDKKLEVLLNGIKVPKNEQDEIVGRMINNFGLSPNKIKKCVFYGRVSTVKAEQRSSIIAQHNIAKDFQEEYMRQGYLITEEVFERKSATSCISRKKFMDIVDRALHGEFNVIVVKNLNRMFRNVDDTVGIMKDLKQANVAIIFYYDHLNTLNTKDRNEIVSRANEAERYSNDLSANVKRGRNRNVLNNKGRVPSYTFGYNKPKMYDSSVLYKDETEAALIMELFTRYGVEQDTIATITKDWRSRGIKTKLDKQISTVAVKRFLNNKMYIGKLCLCRKDRQDIREEWKKKPEDEWVEIDRPDLRIVTDELFELCQKRLHNELNYNNGYMKNVPKERIFKSMIRCSCCGKNFKKIRNGRVNDIYTQYYVCSSRKTTLKQANGIVCDNKTTIRKDELVDSLNVYFKEILRNREDIKDLIKNSVTSILEKTKAKDNKLEESKELALYKQRYAQELKLFRDGISDDTTELKKLKTAIDKIESDIAVKRSMQSINYNVDEVVEKLFVDIDSLVNNGLNMDNIDKVDAMKLNGLFESVIAHEDGHLEFNLLASKYLTSTFCNTNRDWCYKKDLQLKQNGLCFISLDNRIDWGKAREEMNSIRNYDTTTRRRYRYCKRYINIDEGIRDSLNIIL